MAPSSYKASRYPLIRERSITVPTLFGLVATWGLTGRSCLSNNHLKFEVADEGLGKFTESFKSLLERKGTKMQSYDSILDGLRWL